MARIRTPGTARTQSALQGTPLQMLRTQTRQTGKEQALAGVVRSDDNHPRIAARARARWQMVLSSQRRICATQASALVRRTDNHTWSHFRLDERKGAAADLIRRIGNKRASWNTATAITVVSAAART